MNLPITINMSRCTGSTFIFFEEISLNMAPIEGFNYKHDWNQRFTRNMCQHSLICVELIFSLISVIFKRLINFRNSMVQFSLVDAQWSHSRCFLVSSSTQIDEVVTLFCIISQRSHVTLQFVRVVKHAYVNATFQFNARKSSYDWFIKTSMGLIGEWEGVQ